MKTLKTWVTCCVLVLLGHGFAWADEQANIATIKKFYEAYATGDANRVADFFSDDIAWRIPGRHPLSGEKRGNAELTAFLPSWPKPVSKPSLYFLVRMNTMWWIFTEVGATFKDTQMSTPFGLWCFGSRKVRLWKQ